MKTIKKMKTKTNFRKAALRSAAVVVSFVLVSITVSAQEFWKKVLTHSSFNEIALAMVETPGKKKVPARAKNENANWYSFDKAFDPALELEGWMLDENLFYNAEMKEKPLEPENRMTSDDFWAM